MSTQVEERIARLEGTVEQIAARLNGIEARLIAIDGRFAQVEQKIDSRFAWLLGVVLTTWMTTMLTLLFHH
jgi:hypothetical protein